MKKDPRSRPKKLLHFTFENEKCKHCTFAKELKRLRDRSFHNCLVPRPQYYASVIRFGSHGPGRKVFQIRHRNQLTAKAWEKAVQELGKFLANSNNKTR